MMSEYASHAAIDENANSTSNVLSSIFERKRKKNRSYSLRAFARDLKLSPGAISQILSGRRRLTFRTASQILRRSNLDTESRSEIQSYFLGNAGSVIAPGIIDIEQDDGLNYDISPDVFSVIADWYHYAILEMAAMEGCEDDPKQLGQRIGVSSDRIKRAIDRLVSLGLLKKKDGYLLKTRKKVSTFVSYGATTSNPLKERQKQILALSKRSLMRDPIEKRVHAAYTLSISEAQIPALRARISEIFDEFVQIGCGENEKIYEAMINLIPLEK